MNPPSSTTPSPSSATSARGNTFSIDYILSSSLTAAAAVKHHHQQKHHQHQPQQPQVHHQQPMAAAANALDQLALMSQQRAQLMAAAAAAAATATNSQLIKIDPPQSPPQLLQQQQQLQQRQQQQNANPNFLYFMACILLNQQQQQNHHRQQIQQQQQQAALVANQQQQLANQNNNRQPIDLARSPMESLNILTRLTGAPMTAGALPTSQTITAIHQHQHQESNGALGKLNQRLSESHQASVRRQPYPLRTPPTQHQTNRGHQAFLFHHQQSPNLRSSPPHLQISNTSSCANSNNNSITNSSNNNTASITVNNHGDKLDNLKPAHSYIGLIGMCILSSPEKRMVLNDIYQFILDNYPYYRNRGSGWRNSVRHNLSLNECFQKAGRAANGKGHYWTIHPANMEDFMQGDFRRRRAQRKVRRWNNMDVPSDESEDESMEDDATKPPLPEHFKRSLEMHRRLELTYQTTAEATTAAIVAAAAAANHAATFALNGPALQPPSSAAP